MYHLPINKTLTGVTTPVIVVVLMIAFGLSIEIKDLLKIRKYSVVKEVLVS